MAIDVPLLKQWDDRWANISYGDSTIAVSGCGPTSFAMIARTYKIDIFPPDAARFAVENSYYPADGGTSWDFFAAAGQHFGVPMHQTADPDEVLQALKRGIPCIGAHGPGEFTQTGHFIVYAYSTDGDQVMVSDPNRDDTCKLYAWDFLVQDNIGTTSYVAFVPEQLPPG